MKKKMIIDDAFIRKWHPQYKEHDEKGYRDIIPVVSSDIARTHTISESTFKSILNWKTARAKGFVEWKNFAKYKKGFRKALHALKGQGKTRNSRRALEVLDDLPGIGIPVASTILHFACPEVFPIVDFRTVGVLQESGHLDKSKSLYHYRDTIPGYQSFRDAIANIVNQCPKRSLRQIDRALFAYHKNKLNHKVKHGRT